MDSNLLFHLKEEGKFLEVFAKLDRQDQTEVIETVVSNIIGTCLTDPYSELEEYGLTQEYLSEIGFDSIEVAGLIDEVVDECPICGWWVEMGTHDNCWNDYDEEDLCEECGLPFEYCEC